MERAEYDRHSRARVAETAKGGVETCNAVQRRTRRSTSTMGGAAPDTIIGRAAADRAGARPLPHVAKMRRSRPRASRRRTPDVKNVRRSTSMPQSKNVPTKISSLNPREIDRDLCLKQFFGIAHLPPISDRFCH